MSHCVFKGLSVAGSGEAWQGPFSSSSGASWGYTTKHSSWPQRVIDSKDRQTDRWTWGSDSMESVFGELFLLRWVPDTWARSWEDRGWWLGPVLPVPLLGDPALG